MLCNLTKSAGETVQKVKLHNAIDILADFW